MGYLDYAGLQYLWGKLKEKFAPKSHSHDDRYYTEAEMDGKLNSKVNNNEAGANGLINKLSTAGGIPNDATVFISQHNDGETASYYRRPISTLWTYIKGKADGVYQPKGSYAVSGHTHDDRYYTETEINAKLDGKSNTGHTHDDRYYTESEIDSKLSGKANSNHSHYSITTVADNRSTNTTPNDYNNTFIFQGLKDNSKINSPSSDTYSYLLGLRGWSGSSGGNSHELAFNNTGVYWRNGSTEWNGWNRLYTENYHPNADHASSADYATNAANATTATKLSSNAGSNNQPVYFSGGKPVAIGYTIAKSVPADAKFTDTNTWRGIQNNLTSDSTDQSLSAAQGKALKALVDGKAPTSHKHTKSQITDFPSSMPASDVYAWAKAATKPSYTKAEVGLGNVDNTADKDKNVKYATSAGSVTNAQCLNNDDKYMKFHWSGQKGQPTWLWGGNDSGDMYVYNPSNFNVNYATTAGTALTAKNLPYSITYEGSYVGTARRDYLYSNDGPNYATETNPIRTTLSKEYDIVVFLEGWSCPTNETCPEKYAFLCLMNDTKFTQSYVVMSALTNEWTRGLSRLQSSGDVAYGPVIEYGNSPKKSIKYRKNGTSIERYWTREKINPSGSLGEPGSENNLDNGAYMLLDRPGKTYHVFGIDIDHRFFVSSHADEEGSEVV